MTEQTTRAPRWDVFAKSELHLIHHALRMIAIHGVGDDQQNAQKLADEAWGHQCWNVQDEQGLIPISTTRRA